ncbi:MAG: FAD-binding protein [Bacteroidetes bacterium]|nr:FAD-binding protein [Bacteroidota bacterium]
MIKEISLVVSPAVAADKNQIKASVCSNFGILENEVTEVEILKRSVDARSRNIKINLKVRVFVNEIPTKDHDFKFKQYKKVSSNKTVIIVGAGPAGLFAALKLIELGVKPIVIERGKDVRERRRDLAAINKEQVVNPNSNYCFGEGGAGTYSDGKLYTRSTKRGDVFEVLKTFVQFGASREILVEAHPHIGTNKLPKIITAMREQIQEAGGEVLFNLKVIDLLASDKKLSGVVVEDLISSNIYELAANSVILATGHSARDIFTLLHKKSILLEFKPFALGVRVEHPQSLIDSIQYHCAIKEVEEQRKYLPAASYSLVEQVDGKGVYSFCMCPGGIIAPCATSPGEVVTNGWSPSKRNNPFANSGLVVSVEEKDIPAFKNYGPLMGMYFQQSVEQQMCKAGGNTQVAPAQRLVDFVNNKLSADIPQTSYQPGVVSAELHQLLPKFVSTRLQKALKEFGKKMRGYYSNEAVLVATESRTSSPVRIPRDKETFQHPQLKGLFPCGEGAGYAGGIISAAIDGERVAEAAANI